MKASFLMWESLRSNFIFLRQVQIRSWAKRFKRNRSKNRNPKLCKPRTIHQNYLQSLKVRHRRESNKKRTPTKWWNKNLLNRKFYRMNREKKKVNNKFKMSNPRMPSKLWTSSPFKLLKSHLLKDKLKRLIQQRKSCFKRLQNRLAALSKYRNKHQKQRLW